MRVGFTIRSNNSGHSRLQTKVSATVFEMLPAGTEMEQRWSQIQIPPPKQPRGLIPNRESDQDAGAERISATGQQHLGGTAHPASMQTSRSNGAQITAVRTKRRIPLEVKRRTVQGRRR
jgi:hypothetical protein